MAAADRTLDLQVDSEEWPRAAQLWEGRTVGGTYRILRSIGSGGMGMVFAACHLRIDRQFAVKVLHHDIGSDPRAVKRFRHELRALAGVNSEHVVNVVDAGELEDSTPYLVMELLTGETLRSCLQREGKLSISRAVDITRQACLGLRVVHAAGLVHRDVKPENLWLLRREDGHVGCKLLDFGICHGNMSLATAQGTAIGTLRYMAPEQLADAASVGPQADVYALGAVLYECITGVAAHQGNTPEELRFSIVSKAPLRMRELRPDLTRDLERVVMRALRKAKDQRYPTVDAFLAALDAHAPGHENGAVVVPRARGAPSKARAMVRRGAMLAAAAGIAALGGVGGWMVRGERASQPSPEPTAKSVPAPSRASSRATETTPDKPPQPPESSAETQKRTPPSAFVDGRAPKRTKQGAPDARHPQASTEANSTDPAPAPAASSARSASPLSFGRL